MKILLIQLTSIPPSFLGGTKTAAKFTFWFQFFIHACGSSILDMYLNNPCASSSMSSLIKPLMRPETGRVLETKSKGSHVYFLQDLHVSSCI